MDRPLVGRCVLVIEDEALIAFDVKTVLEDAGAKVVLACSAAEALKVVEEANLSAAVVDPSLDDCDNSEVHARLRQRNIPFVTYSALSEAESQRGRAHLSGPATAALLVATLIGLLHARPIAH